MLARLSLSLGARVLDYGCGKGNTIRRVLQARPDLRVRQVLLDHLARRIHDQELRPRRVQPVHRPPHRHVRRHRPPLRVAPGGAHDVIAEAARRGGESVDIDRRVDDLGIATEVLGDPLLRMFGKDFVAGYPLMFVIAVGLLARAAVGPAERLLNMLGERRSCAHAYAGAFLLNVALCFVLIPRFGAMGAAIASAIALVFESAWLFLIAKFHLGFHCLVFGRPKGS